MTLPVRDPFWTEITDFIRQTIGDDAPFIGPRELLPDLPKVFSYDWIHMTEVLRDYRGVAIHKGLMHELPVPILQAIRDGWKCVFASPVFLFFMPQSSPLPAISGDHLGAFNENLVLLEKLDAAKRSLSSEATACVVLARTKTATLDATLRSLSLLHLAVVVVPVQGDETFHAACRDLCGKYRADFQPAGANDALKAGVTHWLAGEQNTWIATFDDSVTVRPDFLAVMEKWRNAKSQQLLGGWWEAADGVRERFQRDGFEIIVPRKPNPRFLYGHRDYWTRRFSSAQNETALPDALLVIPGLVIPHA
ncbi:MAG: hypothetical protein WCD79_00665 [Chthoniobacteraceae bacterium]